MCICEHVYVCVCLSDCVCVFVRESVCVCVWMCMCIYSKAVSSYWGGEKIRGRGNSEEKHGERTAVLHKNQLRWIFTKSVMNTYLTHKLAILLLKLQ